MADKVAIFENINTIYEYLTAIGGGVAAFFSGFGLKKKKSKKLESQNDELVKTNKSLDDKFTKISDGIESINKLICDMKTDFDGVKDTIDKFDDRIQSLEKSLLSVKQHIEVENTIHSLRRLMKSETTKFIIDNQLNEISDSKFISLLVLGRNEAIKFATDCINNGLKDISINDLEIGISSTFDSLRIHAEKFMSDDFVDELKENTSVRQHIEIFKSDLTDIAAGLFNGKTNSAFQNTMIKFINNMYSDGLLIYRKNKKHYKKSKNND